MQARKAQIAILDEQLAIDRWLLQCEQQLRRSTVQLPHRPPRISESFLSQPSWTTTTKKKITEQNLFVRSGTSEAEVTNNRRLRSTYCTIETNYWQTRSIARPLCESRATSCINGQASGDPVEIFTNSKQHY